MPTISLRLTASFSTCGFFSGVASGVGEEVGDDFGRCLPDWAATANAQINTIAIAVAEGSAEAGLGQDLQRVVMIFVDQVWLARGPLYHPVRKSNPYLID